MSDGKPDLSKSSYFWTHDVLNLTTYGLNAALIPFREVQYFKSGGGVANVDLSPKEKELASEVASLQKQLGQKNGSDDQQALEKKVAALEGDIAVLKEKDTKLAAELTARTDEVGKLQEQLNKEKDEKQALEEKVAGLEANSPTDDQTITSQVADLQEQLKKEKDDKGALEEKVAGLEADVATLQEKLSNAPTDQSSESAASQEELKASQEELKKEKDDKQALEEKVAGLEAEIATLKDNETKLNADLAKWKDDYNTSQEELHQEKNHSDALEKVIEDLDKKTDDLEAQLQENQKNLEELRIGTGGGSQGEGAGAGESGDVGEGGEKSTGAEAVEVEPWMNDHSVLDDWVGADKLIQKFSRNPPLEITKSGAEFIDDDTTNVQSKYFSRALIDGKLEYPVKVISVDELIPNKEKARFDPNVWGLLNNGGTIYLARSKR